MKLSAMNAVFSCVAIAACSPSSPSTRTTNADVGSETAQLSPQQDAYVAGTTFNAVADIRCSGLGDATTTQCRAGVIRRQDGSAEVTVFGDREQRLLHFDADNRVVGSSLAASALSSSVDASGWVMVELNAERYSFPVEFLKGD
ncbi:hypothetical protein [Brevundimonas intermedia]|uniref:hypothetical protein n=1 Tax=Brevundimonas intermedia TaxID=74315 RepID=UPI00320A2E8F